MADHRTSEAPDRRSGHPGTEVASPALLLNIADLCCVSAGNSWALDRSIFKACHRPTVWAGSRVISWFGDGPYGCNTEDGKRHLDCINAPNYTASIDTAVSLVPEGFYWHVGHGRTRDDEPLGGASVIAAGSLETISEAEATTAALALCAAALRARASNSPTPQTPSRTEG